MNHNNIKDELKNIFQGKGSISQGKLIEATTCYLRRSVATSGVAKTKQHNKEQEAEKLIEFIKLIIFGIAKKVIHLLRLCFLN